MNNNLYDVIEHGVAVSELLLMSLLRMCNLPPELCVEKGIYNFYFTS